MNDQYTAEYRLVRLLHAFLNKLAFDDTDIDGIEAVVEAGFRQDMAPLTFCAVKDLPGFKAHPRFSEWQQRFLNDMMRSEIQLSEYRNLVDYLCENGVEILPLKGVEIKQLYPSPVLRVMSDVDLLYKGISSKQLSKLMTAFGYTEKSIETAHHDVYHKKPCMNIEMHRKLVDDDSPYTACLEHFSANKIPDAHTPHLYHCRPEDLYIHVIVHAAKHLTSSGLGVRPLCDVYILNKAFAASWDETYIREMLNKADLNAFSDKMTGLAQKWFGDGMPDFEKEDERFFFTGGTYNSNMTKTKWEYAQSGKHSRVSYILSKVFQPLVTMQSAYPVLRKAPFLLPVFWLVRCFEVLFHRRNKITEAVTIGKSDREDIEYASRIITAFGLNRHGT